MKNMILKMICSLLFLSAAPGIAEISSLKSWKNKTVYSKVGIHAEWKRDFYKSYSTNHIGLRDFFPVNTKFQIDSINEDGIELKIAETNNVLKIEYVKKHNQISMDDYLNRTFSSEMITLSDKLTADEKTGIAKGELKLGMSRQAIFLAIGYPPASLNSNFNGSAILYEKKRFNKVELIFEADKLAKIRE